MSDATLDTLADAVNRCIVPDLSEPRGIGRPAGDLRIIGDVNRYARDLIFDLSIYRRRSSQERRAPLSRVAKWNMTRD